MNSADTLADGTAIQWLFFKIYHFVFKEKVLLGFILGFGAFIVAVHDLQLKKIPFFLTLVF